MGEHEERLKVLKIKYYDILNQMEAHSELILKHREMIERMKVELDQIKKQIKDIIWRP
jgi:hypothetical protein